MLGTRLKITAYDRHHRSALLDLTWYSQWAHRHLDWYKTGQWLDQEFGHVLLAWQGDELVGYLGLSLPIDGCSWIRLLGICDGRMPGLVVRELWESAESRCLEQGISSVVILMVTNWLPTYLSKLGFENADDIITMNHIGSLRPAQPSSPAQVRSAEAKDVEQLLHIDRLAFQVPWQLSHHDMWQGFRMASSATIATLDGEVVGYQLSTRQDEVGHLARLAVDPAHRRKGIASALLHHLMDDFWQRGVTDLSVNTQMSNLPSQRLYERYGFFRNGYDLELWHKQLN